ncbi:MAG: FKBP-type peptidyl-prolyl cis-trans isomerase [Syntrophobacteraceae bacterium]
MQIVKDSFVVIEYSLRLDDGSLVKGENTPASMNFIVGYGQILAALEKGLIGLEQGAQTELTISASDGFGEYDESLVHTMDLCEFPPGRDLEPGRWAVAKNKATGAQYSYLIKEKTDSTITLDYNHPLAGKDLYYLVNVVLVRPAQAEELEFLRPCEHGHGPPRED